MESQVKVEHLDTSCYLIRKALDIPGQVALLEDIESKDRQSSSSNSQPPKKALYPTPRTVRWGENKTKLRLDRSTATIYSALVDKANDAILQATSTTEVSLGAYKSITLSAIEYQAGKHTLAEHVDHDDSFVYLLSLGCTTSFVIKGPNMAEKRTIALQSGDLLVFDASTKGNIVHGIRRIEEGKSGACPAELAHCFPILANHRYGVQLRVRF